jgi:hypothetical protein
MARLNMEVARFGAYLFVPIAFFYFSNHPWFHENHIKPDLVGALPWLCPRGSLCDQGGLSWRAASCVSHFMIGHYVST